MSSDNCRYTDCGEIDCWVSVTLFCLANRLEGHISIAMGNFKGICCAETAVGIEKDSSSQRPLQTKNCSICEILFQMKLRYSGLKKGCRRLGM